MGCTYGGCIGLGSEQVAAVRAAPNFQELIKLQHTTLATEISLIPHDTY
jgi:hypothetical protein